ncbi:MAG: APC family permease [Fimbriimonadaceae bacterium]|nr:APC family permease [Fimbriimonadaceae bacterium]
MNQVVTGKLTTWQRLRRAVLGSPIATKRAHHEKLSVTLGLPVFASDALSSVAYASEEILHVLVVAGIAGFTFLTPVSLWLVVLMLIIAFSYYQTIQAYPAGGGTYIVSTENLGSGAGRVAGAALLIDYVLTVAVSISSGVAAVVSLAPSTQDYGVWIGVTAIAVLCLANLRGVKESGAIFALPTYVFVVLVLALVGTAVFRGVGQPAIQPTIHPPQEGFHAVTMFLLLRAFAASCAALTGTEAIADGVGAFKEPAAKNAGRTLIAMVVLLLVMFVGISWSAQHFGVQVMEPTEPGFKTVLAQLAVAMFGEGPFFYVIQIATAAILFLAANTAFADFPRLCSFVARDGFMPRQLTSLGDRLVFQNGIVVLSVVAAGLLVVYNADTHSLIPLYALGVFVSFTLSQAGVCRKFVKERKADPANARRHTIHAALSGFGAVVTTVVSLILLVTKFSEGAWLILVAMTVLLSVFSLIRRHYDHLANELNLRPEDTVEKVQTIALLLVPRVHRGVLRAIAYAQGSARDCRALHVTLDPASSEKLKQEWNRLGIDMPLVILDSPYRSLVEPVVDYIDETTELFPDHMVTVIVPQAVPSRWVQGLLHTNAALGFKLALASRPQVAITNVRYFLK